MNVIRLSHYLNDQGNLVFVASCAGRVAVDVITKKELGMGVDYHSEAAKNGICHLLAESLKIVGNYEVQEVSPDEHDTDE